MKKDRGRASEKKKGESVADAAHSERSEKPAKDNKKDENNKRERLRNKVTTVGL